MTQHTAQYVFVYIQTCHTSQWQRVCIKYFFLLLIIRQTRNLHCSAIKEFCLSHSFGGLYFCSFIGLMYHKVVIAWCGNPTLDQKRAKLFTDKSNFDHHFFSFSSLCVFQHNSIFILINMK